jgi:hypothetical protein
MADEEFQKERPQFQKELSQRAARLESRPLKDDDNRFRLADPVRNRMALVAFWLGILCIIVPGLFVKGLTISSRNLTDINLFNERQGSFDYPASRWVDWAVILAWVLGPPTLVFGIQGVRYRIRHPTAGGLGYAAFGIVMGALVYLLYSFYSWLLIFWVGGHWN